VAALAPLVADERQLFVLMSVFVLAVFGTSYNILLGYTGLVSFAHAAYYGIGAYTVALLALHLGLSPLVGMALGPVVAGAVAFATGIIALRATRLYFALLTLALGQLMFLVAFQWRSFTRGDDGIHGIVLPPALDPTTARYYAILALAAVAILVMGLVMRSPFGAALRAIRENRQRAGFLGINVRRYELASFTLGGTFAGYAGAMYALYDRSAFPLLLSWTTSAEPIFVALIGGISSFAGPVVGAVVFGLLQDWITRNIDYWQAVLGVVLLLIILFQPGGIVAGVQRLAQVVRRRLDRRPRPATGEAEDGAGDVMAPDDTTTVGATGSPRVPTAPGSDA
jgi:branched-chain amino acid transport system permease protein